MDEGADTLRPAYDALVNVTPISRLHRSDRIALCPMAHAQKTTRAPICACRLGHRSEGSRGPMLHARRQAHACSRVSGFRSVEYCSSFKRSGGAGTLLWGASHRPTSIRRAERQRRQEAIACCSRSARHKAQPDGAAPPYSAYGGAPLGSSNCPRSRTFASSAAARRAVSFLAARWKLAQRRNLTRSWQTAASARLPVPCA